MKSKTAGVDPKRLQAFLNFRRDNPEVTSPLRIAEALRISESAVRRLLKRPDAQVEPAPSVGTKISDEACELVTENPCTLDDLLRICKVDLKVWRVARFVANKWEVGTAQENGSVLRTPLFQIKAFLERIPGLEDAAAIREVVEWIRKNPPVPKEVKRAKPLVEAEDPHLLIVNLCDLHFDRLAWGEETGNNWDMKISSSVAVEAVERLLQLTAAFPVRKILYVAGNDMMTADNHLDTTTAGTPQIVDGRWQKSFRLGVALQHRIVERLRRRAPVDLLVVNGNHDTCRAFYSGEVLSAMYSKARDVRVINSVQTRKYYRWGTSLAMFTHGNDVKLNSLPLIMAGEAGKDWAETTHREVFCGHFHHRKDSVFNSGDEVGSVRLRILPSLTPADAWHSSKGFVNSKRASEAYVFSESNGYVGHVSWGPKEQRKIEVLQGANE